MTSGSFEQHIEQALTYWRLVLAYKWYILVGTLAMTLAATVFIARLPNMYEATTTILVDPQQIPEKYVSPAVSADPYTRLNTITQQVLSRTRLQEILDKLNLYPELRNSDSPEELIAKMRGDISIQVKQGDGAELSTFTITYQGKHPLIVAKVANELAASFIQSNVSSREAQVAGTKEFLTSELETAKQSLEQQEDKLRQFKMAHLGETPDQSANNLQALVGLHSTLQSNADALNRLDQERVQLTSLPESIVTSANPQANLTERGRLEEDKQELEAKIQQLRERYSDNYPDVVSASQSLAEVNTKLNSLPPDTLGRVPDQTQKPSVASIRLQLIEKEMNRLKDQQAQIETQIGAYQAKLDAAPLREEQLVELNRNYDISKQNYQTLLDKSFSADMAADLEQNQKGERFRILDPAEVPEKPVSPNRRTLIPLSGLSALGFAIFLAIAKEAISPAIQTETEVRELLPTGVRIMGLIPRITVAADTRRDRWFALSASLVCGALCLAVLAVIWRIRLVL